jgi:hypothetical protein
LVGVQRNHSKANNLPELEKRREQEHVVKREYTEGVYVNVLQRLDNMVKAELLES